MFISFKYPEIARCRVLLTVKFTVITGFICITVTVEIPGVSDTSTAQKAPQPSPRTKKNAKAATSPSDDSKHIGKDVKSILNLTGSKRGQEAVDAQSKKTATEKASGAKKDLEQQADTKTKKIGNAIEQAREKQRSSQTTEPQQKGSSDPKDVKGPATGNQMQKKSTEQPSENQRSIPSKDVDSKVQQAKVKTTGVVSEKQEKTSSVNDQQLQKDKGKTINETDSAITSAGVNKASMKTAESSIKKRGDTEVNPKVKEVMLEIHAKAAGKVAEEMKKEQPTVTIDNRRRRSQIFAEASTAESSFDDILDEGKGSATKPTGQVSISWVETVNPAPGVESEMKTEQYTEETDSLGPVRPIPVSGKQQQIEKSVDLLPPIELAGEQFEDGQARKGDQRCVLSVITDKQPSVFATTVFFLQNNP